MSIKGFMWIDMIIAVFQYGNLFLSSFKRNRNTEVFMYTCLLVARPMFRAEIATFFFLLRLGLSIFYQSSTE